MVYLSVLSRRIGEYVMRKTENQNGLSAIFNSSIRKARYPFTKRGSENKWCEVWYQLRDCYFPFGQGLCKHCDVSSPCPKDYQISYAYGYTTTGCWCVALPHVSKVCCDCTPLGNNPYRRHVNDCQCQHTL